MDRAAVRKLAAVCALCAAAPAAWGLTDLARLDDVDLGAWSGGGSAATGADDFCVANDPGLGNSGNPGNYGLEVRPLAGTTFELVSTADPAMRLPVQIAFDDLIAGTSETLVPAVLTQRNKRAVVNCAAPDNARLTVRASPAALQSVPPGDYVASFRFTARQASRVRTADFTARVSIRYLIRISGLDSIDLGTFSGVADARGGDDFCVYTNNPAGTYAITAYGQGPTGSMLLRSAGAEVPFLLEYDDGSGFTQLSPNVPVTRGNASGSAPDCAGASNAGIRVTAGAAALRDAPAGTYTGELVLMVAPL